MVSFVEFFLKIYFSYFFFVFLAPKIPKITREEANAERLSQIPGIQRLGPIHKSSSPVQLTESETEYTVSCVKHCFTNHMIFQVRFSFYLFVVPCLKAF